MNEDDVVTAWIQAGGTKSLDEFVADTQAAEKKKTERVSQADEAFAWYATEVLKNCDKGMRPTFTDVISMLLLMLCREPVLSELEHKLLARLDNYK